MATAFVPLGLLPTLCERSGSCLLAFAALEAVGRCALLGREAELLARENVESTMLSHGDAGAAGCAVLDAAAGAAGCADAGHAASAAAGAAAGTAGCALWDASAVGDVWATVGGVAGGVLCGAEDALAPCPSCEVIRNVSRVRDFPGRASGLLSRDDAIDDVLDLVRPARSGC